MYDKGNWTYPLGYEKRQNQMAVNHTPRSRRLGLSMRPETLPEIEKPKECNLEAACPQFLANRQARGQNSRSRINERIGLEKGKRGTKGLRKGGKKAYFYHFALGDRGIGGKDQGAPLKP